MITGLEQYKEKWQIQSEQVIKPGLDAMEQALELLGHPERETIFIHVAGTNGKGSTIAFLEAILREHHVTVGKFMSPCILDVHDQIQINGEPIDKAEIDRLFQEMQQAGISGTCTDFELLTCAALLHFKNKDVDIALIETGMGGLLDSTNVITPVVSIISSIALEHTNFLGNTLADIAYHKAGIIKKGVPIVIGNLPEEALEVVKKTAAEKEAKLFILGRDFNVKNDCFEYMQVKLDALTRKMVGNHQANNMALAITAFLQVAAHLRIEMDGEALKKGVASASLAGRFEEVLPNVYFDGAHNPASAEKLVETIKTHFPRKNIEFVVGMLADKEIDAVLRLFEQVSTTFTFVNFDSERAMKAKDIIKKSRAVDRRITHDPISYLQQPKDERTIIIVTGSLYLLSMLRAQLKCES
ncbi:bifunctional folylpolyglutamate synthase/dihydrofolate synthase [Lysinibacillus sp. LZ02]|uniref:bifunctional folylpolyglutamate synthase/dihydrofolate synthase n=1 Tax=Lysinibacillus sp. LZ02 TaxID=3420668 RepID=UPI003D360324